MKTNWPVKKLREIADVIMGQSPSSSTYNSNKDGLPFYQGKVDFGELYPTPRIWCSAPIKITEPDDVLISVRAPVGPTNLSKEKSCIGRGLAALRSKPKMLDHKYLLLYLRSIEGDLTKQGSGTTFSAIGKKELENLEISVPTFEEQRRIVKKLGKILAKIEKTRTLRQESIEEGQNIIRSKLGELFENNSWDETRVSDIAEKPQYGYTAPSAKDKIGPRLLRITDIQNGMVDWENVPYCKCNEVDKYGLTSGDIVFARTGATTGKSFLIKDTPEQTVFASYLIRLKTKGSIKQEFLYWFFQSPQYWNQITEHQAGSAQPNVNAVKLASVKLRMPQNLKEQEKIVAYLDDLSEKVQALQKLQQEQFQDLEALQQSVLHQAFLGKL